MVQESDLLPGEVYFSLFYHDSDLKIPDITTLIYVGKGAPEDSKNNKEDRWYFVEPEDYLRKNKAVDVNSYSGCILHRFDLDSLTAIYDWKSFVRELGENKDCQDRGSIFT